MRTCIFQLYAPLVSWGEIAVGGERRSAVQPSKSAIIGLIAAALGIKREEEERLNQLANAIGMAVRVDAAGSVMKDYHTAQVPKGKGVYRTRKDEISALSENDNAVLSSREYRCDAYALVAIWLRNDEFNLDTIAHALKHPAFHLYLGRKSAPPALPLYPQIIEKDTLREAFAAASFPVSIPVDKNSSERQKKYLTQYTKGVLRSKNCTYYWEEGVAAGIKPLQKISRYDMPLSRKRWQFTLRDEYMAIEERGEVANVHE